MDYYILVCLLIVVGAIIYMWYASPRFQSIPDGTPLKLGTEEDRLLSQWYATQIKPSFNFDIDETRVGAELINQLLNPTESPVDPGTIVVGTNLAAQYHNLTRRHFDPNYGPEKDCLFDLRSLIGKPGEIAIVQDPRVRNSLRRANRLNMIEISSIVELRLAPLARDYLQKVLTERWTQLIKLNDPMILNRGGSYLYLRESHLPHVEVADVHGIKRINLLCSDLEFKTLLQRWPQPLARA